jgi:hypothetical protein
MIFLFLVLPLFLFSQDLFAKQVENQEISASMLEISNHLKKFLPDMAASLKDFSDLNKKASSKSEFIWIEENGKKGRVPSADINPSEDCFQGSYKFSDVAKVEYNGVNRYIITYDKEALQELEQNKKQLLCFYLHSWLLKFTEDENQIPQVIKFIASNEINLISDENMMLGAFEARGLAETKLGRKKSKFDLEMSFGSN